MLFLFADTGGGHRRAAEAVIEALADGRPGSFRTILHDPLLGPDAARPQRWLGRLYGPAVRWAPWAWGAGYWVSNSRLAMALLARTAFAPAARSVARQVRRGRPDVIVSCHPLTGRAAVLAARRQPVPAAVVTVVTDLVRVHASWLEPGAGPVVVPSAEAAAACRAAGLPASRCTPAGLPVGRRMRPERNPAARAALRRSAGLPADRFVVLLAGGGEGCGGIGRRATAILRRFADVHVVAACGRNERLRRRLSTAAGHAGGRLTVLGYVGNFADWLRVADVVVTKAGPGIIAEAACCGTPLLLTSHLPGQERGNAGLVLRAGAGRSARGVRGMLAELAEMRADARALTALRAGSASLARPGAAVQVAGIIAGLVPVAGGGLTAAGPASTGRASTVGAGR